MKRGTKLTPKLARDITQDWQRAIPSLGVYRPRWLLRRVGPLLVGICLERDSSGEIYKPIFHTHCLAESQSFISLSLSRQLRDARSGGPTFLPLHLHAQKYQAFAELMVAQALLPLSGDLSFTQIKNAYFGYINQPGGWSQSGFLMRNLVLIAAWTRQPELAVSLLSDCMRIPDDILFSPWGSRCVFEESCRRLMANPTLIDETVAAEIVKHNLSKLPVSRLLP